MRETHVQKKGFEREYSGKRAEPSVEELIFIYSRLEKLSDAEILEEMQDESFPLRSASFMKRRRRDFQAAKTVLQKQIESALDPMVIEAQKQHLDEVGRLLARWRKEIWENQEKGEYEVICRVEGNSLFLSVLTHSPGVNKALDEYNPLREEYHKLEKQILRGHIIKIPEWVHNDYEKSALYCAIRMYDEEMSPEYEYVGSDRGWVEEIFVKIGKTRIKIGMRDASIYKYKPEKSIYNSIVDGHRELTWYFEGDRRMKKLSRTREQLKELQKNLLKEILSCYDGKAYIKIRCDNCPDKKA